jgi:hypothetical protein
MEVDDFSQLENSAISFPSELKYILRQPHQVAQYSLLQ